MRTVGEWLQAFNLYYNNIASDKAPGLEPYEISKILTDAQEVVEVAAYKGTLTDPFESTEEVTAYLGTLVRQADCVLTSTEEANAAYKVSSDSVLYKNPTDLLFRTWEGAKITVPDCGEKDVRVVPTTQDDYWRAVKNPFRGPNARKVLRLSYAVDQTSGAENYGNTPYSELISKYPITSYTVRYLKKPDPIILTNLSDGLTINGQSTAMTCKFPEALHQAILAEAVRMAKAMWTT